jgi:hypothetical protein
VQTQEVAYQLVREADTGQAMRARSGEAARWCHCGVGDRDVFPTEMLLHMVVAIAAKP